MCDSWPTVNLSEYKAQVGQIPYGKRLPTALYVHREGLAGVGGNLGTVLDQVVARYQVTMEFNLVKFRTDELKLSFLSYPEFDSDPHPALRHAITVDLVKGKARHTDYAGNMNPPILHRKESFLPPDHPRRAEFAALTQAEERAGLYEDTSTIGFKLNWEKLLQAKGLVIKGHRLVKTEATSVKSESGGLEREVGAVAVEPTESSIDFAYANAHRDGQGTADPSGYVYAGLSVVERKKKTKLKCGLCCILYRNFA